MSWLPAMLPNPLQGFARCLSEPKLCSFNPVISSSELPHPMPFVLAVFTILLIDFIFLPKQSSSLTILIYRGVREMYDSLSKITLGDIVSTFSTPKSPLPPTYWTILEQMYGSVDDLDQTFPQVPQRRFTTQHDYWLHNRQKAGKLKDFRSEYYDLSEWLIVDCEASFVANTDSEGKPKRKPDGKIDGRQRIRSLTIRNMLPNSVPVFQAQFLPLAGEVYTGDSTNDSIVFNQGVYGLQTMPRDIGLAHAQKLIRNCQMFIAWNVVADLAWLEMTLPFEQVFDLAYFGPLKEALGSPGYSEHAKLNMAAFNIFGLIIQDSDNTVSGVKDQTRFDRTLLPNGQICLHELPSYPVHDDNADCLATKMLASLFVYDFVKSLQNSERVYENNISGGNAYANSSYPPRNFINSSSCEIAPKSAIKKRAGPKAKGAIWRTKLYEGIPPMGYIERSRLPQIDSLAFSNGIVIVGALANRKHAPAFARIVTSYIQLMGWNRDAQELPKIIGVISTENVVVLGLNCVSSDRELILIQETIEKNLPKILQSMSGLYPNQRRISDASVYWTRNFRVKDIEVKNALGTVWKRRAIELQQSAPKYHTSVRKYSDTPSEMANYPTFNGGYLIPEKDLTYIIFGNHLRDFGVNQKDQPIGLPLPKVQSHFAGWKPQTNHITDRLGFQGLNTRRSYAANLANAAAGFRPIFYSDITGIWHLDTFGWYAKAGGGLARLLTGNPDLIEEPPIPIRQMARSMFETGLSIASILLFPDIVVTNDRKKGEGDYVHADIGSRGGVLGGLKPSSDFGPLPPWFFNDLPNFAQLPEVSQAIVKAQLTGKGDIQHSFFAFSRDFLGLVLKEPGNEELAYQVLLRLQSVNAEQFCEQLFIDEGEKAIAIGIIRNARNTAQKKVNEHIASGAFQLPDPV